jgi:hypothetical protein
MSKLVAALRKPFGAVDIYRDLGCTRVTTSSSTYNEATSTSNTTKINTWLDGLEASSAAPRTLVIPYGFVAINGTLGALLGDETRSLPANVCIIGSGGWARGIMGVEKVGHNTGCSGFMWTGGTGEPMVALQRWGNVLSCNWYGYPYVGGVHTDGDFPDTRCYAAIQLTDAFGICGKHQIYGAYTGFEQAIRIDSGTSPHADESQFPYALTYDCPKFVYCDNQQAVSHHFGKIYFNGTAGAQSTVFDVQAGGNWVVDLLGVVSDYGVTVLNIGAATPNAGYFDIRANIDRSVVIATKASNGYLRLVNGEDQASIKVRMSGMVMWANEDLTTGNWINGGGQAIISHVSPTGGNRVNINLDMWGIPDSVRDAYPW